MKDMAGSSADGDTKIAHYLLVRGRFLGCGAQGSVCFGILKYGSSAIPVAVKSAILNEHWSPLRRESQFLKHLGESEHIVKFFGESDNGAGSYELFLEFAPDGSLRDLLKRNGSLPERDVRRLTRSILQGLLHIHRRGAVHCDIKPANLLLVKNKDKAKEKVIKIADFGSALWSDEENHSRYRGTPYYLAPEGVKNNEYGAPTDIWALGCTVAEMVLGKAARSYTKEWASEVEDLLDAIASGGAMPEIPEDMSEMGKDFLSRCFVVHPGQRWTAEMLLEHPFAALTTTSDHLDDDGTEAAAGAKFSTWKETVSEKFNCLAEAQSDLDHYSQSDEQELESDEHEQPSAVNVAAGVLPTPAKECTPVTKSSSSSSSSSSHAYACSPQDDGAFDIWKEDVFDIYGKERVLDIINSVHVGAPLPYREFDMWNEQVFDIYGPERVLSCINAANKQK